MGIGLVGLEATAAILLAAMDSEYRGKKNLFFSHPRDISGSSRVRFFPISLCRSFKNFPSTSLALGKSPLSIFF